MKRNIWPGLYRAFAACLGLSLVAGVGGYVTHVVLAAPPTCNGLTATIYVEGGFIVGGPDNGDPYTGTLNGTGGTDVMVGTSGNDIINGFGGANTICSLDGEDNITTGGGTDWIDSAEGNDTINAGAGLNTINAGDGNNNITTGGGTDNITTGSGDDVIDASSGLNTINAGEGNNTVTGAGGTDNITTGGGNDIINAGSGLNNVNAGGGNDSVTGAGGTDVIDGGPGYDFCTAGSGSNTVINCESEAASQGVVIVKEATPDTVITFGFSGDLGVFALGDGGSAVFTPGVGSYAVTEDATVGWTLESIECDDPDDGTTIGNPTATIDLDANEVVVCTFFNEEDAPAPLGSITIIKEATPEDGTDFPFTLDPENELLDTVGFTLDDDADGTLENNYTASGLSAGNYSVTEALPTGWDLLGVVCSEGTEYAYVGEGQTDITLGEGQDVTCTYTNVEESTAPLCEATYPLYADGSIACTGADDLSTIDGSTTVTPVVGGVNFTVDLTSAEPNRTYTIAISEEPSCGSAVFYPGALTTDGSGAGTYSDFYPTTPGAHTLLVNMNTDASGLSDPRHREIGTTDVPVVVPDTEENACVAPPQECTLTAVSDPDTTIVELGNAPSVVVTPHPSWPALSGASWIWNEEVDGTGSHTPEPETFTFTREFELDGLPVAATLDISTDNVYSVTLNGNPVGTDGDWANIETYVIPNGDFLVGTNTLTIVATNEVRPEGYTGPNPGGVLYKLVVEGTSEEACVEPPAEETTLTVIKNVLNNFGGLLTPADFNLTVTWYNGNTNDESEPYNGFPGDSSGTDFFVNPGTFLVGETWIPGYSMVGDTSAGPRCASNATINDGEHLTCTITNKQIAYGGEELSCEDIEGGSGWYGNYFNYSKSLPEMYSIYEGEPVPPEDGLGTELWGQPGNGSDTAASWYATSGPHYRFSRIDSDLEFGDMFWPFYDADPAGSISDPLDSDPGLVEEESYGNDRDFHFGTHWSATVNVPTDAAGYNFYGKVDDDIWIYVNGTLYTFPPPTPTGVHGPVGINGTLTLSDGDIIDVYYADRAPTGSSMYLEFLNNTDGDENNNILFYPHNADLDCDPPLELPECSDLADNDQDTFTDYPADPNCSSPEDDSEAGEYGAYCGDGTVNQEWEQCDIDNASCTDQCQLVENNQCTDLVLARVVVENVDNNEYVPSGEEVTSDIFLGDGTLANKIPSGAWFLVHTGGSYVLDPNNLDDYENVPGIAVRRLAGSINTRLHGSHEQQVVEEETVVGREHADGYLEFWSWDGSVVPTQMSSQVGQNQLEQPFNNDTSGNQDEIDGGGDGAVELADLHANFWTTVTTQDDGFRTFYSDAPICPTATATVTICKYDEEQDPLAGWQVLLKGDFVELLSVDSTDQDGSNTLASLIGGAPYLANAYGTWSNQNGANLVDSEYSTTDSWATQMDGYTGYPTEILELNIGGDFSPSGFGDWGLYNSAHNYWQAFSPAATGTEQFVIFDGHDGAQDPSWFGDNSGSLSVEVWEGWSGITDENGCVAFENVPQGTYTLDEALQDGWENVSGQGETVIVDDSVETFNLVNQSTLPPTLTIVKNTVGGDGTFSFQVTGDTSTSTQVTTSGGSGTSTVLLLNEGTSTVSELPSLFWQFNSVECVYENESVGSPVFYGEEITVENGDDVTCTFTNTAQPIGDDDDDDTTITVIKQTNPDLDQTDFDFLLNGSPFGAPLSDGESSGAIVVSPGINDLSEVAEAGWTLTDANCLDESQNPTGLEDSDGVYLNLLAGDDITCTFTNTVNPSGDDDDASSISGTKWNDLDGNGTQDGGETGISGWVINITNDDAFSASTTTDESGNYSFTGLSADTYFVCEALQGSGWSQTHPTLVTASSTDCQGDGRGYEITTLGNGDTWSDNDFGNQQPSGLSGDDDDGGPQIVGFGNSGGGGGGNNNGGEVLGAATDSPFCPFLQDYLHITFANDPEEVNKVKAFFNAYLGTSLVLNGIFDQALFDAVVQFQTMFEVDVLDPWAQAFPGILTDDATGYIYQTTLWKINSIMCPGYQTFPETLIIDPTV